MEKFLIFRFQLVAMLLTKIVDNFFIENNFPFSKKVVSLQNYKKSTQFGMANKNEKSEMAVSQDDIIIAPVRYKRFEFQNLRQLCKKN